jgi:hypothetical protein
VHHCCSEGPINDIHDFFGPTARLCFDLPFNTTTEEWHENEVNKIISNVTVRQLESMILDAMFLATMRFLTRSVLSAEKTGRICTVTPWLHLLLHRSSQNLQLSSETWIRPSESASTGLFQISLDQDLQWASFSRLKLSNVFRAK